MSPAGLVTSPVAHGEQRKFINPTPGYVGANIFSPEGKPTAVAVEPGGEIWLTAEEERMTAEAPRAASDNPFIREWDEAVEFDAFGEPTRTVRRRGTLVLSDEPARPVASDRFIPGREQPVNGAAHSAVDPDSLTTDQLEALLASKRAAEAPAAESEPEPEPQETVKGADVPPPSEQPPVQGHPAPDEVVGAPEAVPANDEALARREPTLEQPTNSGGGIPV